MSYQYDGNGNLTRRQDARGVVTVYTYDALNRPLTRDYSDATPARRGPRAGPFRIAMMRLEGSRA